MWAEAAKIVCGLPVNMLPVIGKILKTEVYKQIEEYFNNKKVQSIRDIILKWFKFYLIDRKRVKLDGKMSINVEWPHRKLSSDFFKIYVNDITISTLIPV